MSTGVTDKGWVSKTKDAIVESQVEDIVEYWGEGTPTTPETVLGQLLQIVSAASKENWELGAQLSDAQNRDSATGINLDYLARASDIYRLKASGAIGYVLFTGENGTGIVTPTVCKTTSDEVIVTTEEHTLSNTACYQSTYTVEELLDNTEYTLIVEGTECSYTTSVNATINEIMVGLADKVNTNTLILAETFEDEFIILTYPSYNNVLSVSNSSNLLLVSIGGLVASESNTQGNIEVYANTVTTLSTSNIGIISVNNPADFESGRDLESDEELRVRMEDYEQSAGTATVPSIAATLASIDGVSSVVVIANDTLIDDESTGVAAKTYECFITGGLDADIGEVLYRTKGVVDTQQGNTQVLIIDDNGDTKAMYFSRPEEGIAWVRVTYEVNDSSVVDSDIENTIRSVVVAKGETFEQGASLDPKQFYGSLFEIEGIYVDNVEVALTEVITDTPVYQDTRIDIAETTVLNFNIDRVEVTI